VGCADLGIGEVKLEAGSFGRATRDANTANTACVRLPHRGASQLRMTCSTRAPCCSVLRVAKVIRTLWMNH